MEYSRTTASPEDTEAFGGELVQDISPGTLLCLYGNLGSGKTTFVQGILAALGANRPFVSPTFVIMKQYELPTPSATGIQRVYHADAYRVETKDFRELGFAEWCADPEGLVILEWPERIADILPEKRIDITFRALTETKREITLEER
ncbi:MAG: tRNA (adenosine(37)-N6)-threonylcarbamoyltransferase complex ATPase subunit type 1 TsaE [Candidatus Moranbacteria bacterium]|nr:tRNA (adenosine(37)-N6)-threonylcarbamoyltransferase complex ATPase subunit type 1 TsaE [Candidatus Moranbacteria bacterium]